MNYCFKSFLFLLCLTFGTFAAEDSSGTKVNGFQVEIAKLTQKIQGLTAKLEATKSYNLKRSLVVTTIAVGAGAYWFKKIRPRMYATQDELQQRLSIAEEAMGNRIDEFERGARQGIQDARVGVVDIREEASKFVDGVRSADNAFNVGMRQLQDQQKQMGVGLENNKRAALQVVHQRQELVDANREFSREASLLHMNVQDAEENFAQLVKNENEMEAGVRAKLEQKHRAQGEQLTGLTVLAVSLMSRLEVNQRADAQEVENVLAGLQDLEKAQNGFSQELELSHNAIQDQDRILDQSIEKLQDTIRLLEGYVSPISSPRGSRRGSMQAIGLGRNLRTGAAYKRPATNLWGGKFQLKIESIDS